MHCPLCIHPHVTDFIGTAHLDAGHRLHLLMAGSFAGADMDDTFYVQVRSVPSIQLPLLLRGAFNAAHAFCPPFECDGSTCITFPVALEAGVLRWTTDLINCEEWTVEVPFLPCKKLQDLIGMRPLHVVVTQGDRVYADFEIQRMQHCQHFHK